MLRVRECVLLFLILGTALSQDKELKNQELENEVLKNEELEEGSFRRNRGFFSDCIRLARTHPHTHERRGLRAARPFCVPGYTVTNLRKNTVHRVLKRHKFHPYKMQLNQELTKDDSDRIPKFCVADMFFGSRSNCGDPENCPPHACRLDDAVVHGFCCGCAKASDRVPIKCPPWLQCPISPIPLCNDYNYMMDCCC
ncbi:hypothetical protein J6590_027098 [Homalodisca vitripennis]|nr:hypothetical protein J6590_027098 [Homalodisca vitripennis]